MISYKLQLLQSPVTRKKLPVVIFLHENVGAFARWRWFYGSSNFQRWGDSKLQKYTLSIFLQRFVYTLCCLGLEYSDCMTWKKVKKPPPTHTRKEGFSSYDTKLD